MSPIEIKEKIDANNAKIETLCNPANFTLNKDILALLDENDKLREQCKHDFCFGKCKYCYSEQK